MIYDVNKTLTAPSRRGEHDGYYMKVYVAPLIILVLLIALFVVEFEDTKLSSYVIAYFLVAVQLIAIVWSP